MQVIHVPTVGSSRRLANASARASSCCSCACCIRCGSWPTAMDADDADGSTGAAAGAGGGSSGGRPLSEGASPPHSTSGSDVRGPAPCAEPFPHAREPASAVHVSPLPLPNLGTRAALMSHSAAHRAAGAGLLSGDTPRRLLLGVDKGALPTCTWPRCRSSGANASFASCAKDVVQSGFDLDCCRRRACHSARREYQGATACRGGDPDGKTVGTLAAGPRSLRLAGRWAAARESAAASGRFCHVDAL